MSNVRDSGERRQMLKTGGNKEGWLGRGEGSLVRGKTLPWFKVGEKRDRGSDSDNLYTQE